jgi:glutaminyl-tRNA synthetase
MDPSEATSKQRGETLPHRPRASKEPNPKQEKPSKPKMPKEAPHDDPDSMFKTGFLADVYRETLTGPEGIAKVVTRFPPEPNGFLHLGHSKAIAIDFGFARFHGGDCNLRFDDTNPSAEEERYFVAIEEVINWLGFKPTNITYSSDNFDRLYELAEDLISRDGAYVCHCSSKLSPCSMQFLRFAGSLRCFRRI